MSVPADAMPTMSMNLYRNVGDVELSAANLYCNVGNVEPSTANVLFFSVSTSTLSVSDRFQSLVNDWIRDTIHLSLISQRIDHPAYRSIIRMGGTAVPLILEEMRRSPGHWFHALTMLANSNPVPPDFDGTVDEAADLWIEWGRQQNLIDP